MGKRVTNCTNIGSRLLLLFIRIGRLVFRQKSMSRPLFKLSTRVQTLNFVLPQRDSNSIYRGFLLLSSLVRLEDHLEKNQIIVYRKVHGYSHFQNFKEKCGKLML